MKRLQSHLGLVLDGALRFEPLRLWLDGRPRGEIAWAGRPGVRMRRRGRLICSSDLLVMLPRGPAPLGLPFDRPLALGRFAVSLSPAGSGPGSSVLRLADNTLSISIATCARPIPLAAAPACLFQRSDVIVVDASEAALSPVPLAELDHALERLAQRAAGGDAIVVCADFAVALTVAARLSTEMRPRLAAGFASLHRHLRVAAEAIRPSRQRRQRSPICHIMPPRAATKWPAELPRLVLDSAMTAALPDDGRAFNPVEQRGGVEILPFGWRARGEEVDALVVASGAMDVVAIGDGAAALSARLSATGARIVALHDELQLQLL